MEARQQRILYIDTQRCMGCRACETVCKLENDLPVGPRYTMVAEVETGEGSTERLNFLPVPCQHCGDAPCVRACPTGALYKRADGVVLVEQSRCIGCHECLMACPFGVPQFGANGRMQKCTMCVHRLDEGMLPACAMNCPAEAILCDTPENISKILRQRYSQNAAPYGPFAALLQEVGR